MKRSCIAIALLLVLTASVTARDLSLSDALRIAGEHSYQVKQARAEAAAAERLAGAARADRLPVLSASASARYVDNLPSLNIEAGSFTRISREIGIKDPLQADVALTLPLFTGGRIGGAIDRADAISALQEALARANLRQVQLHTRVEYFSLMKADRQLAAARSSLSRAQIAANDVNSLYSAGAADSIDILESSMAVTNARFTVEQAVVNRRAAEIRLLTLLGSAYTDTLILTEPLRGPSSFHRSVEVAPTMPELQAVMANVSAREAEHSMVAADFWPTLSAVGGYSIGKPNRDVFNNDWDDYFSVGARLTWSFGVSTGKRSQAARHQLTAARRQHLHTAETLNREARLAAELLELAFLEFETARRQQRLAADNYRLASAKHSQGDLPTNRLLETEQSLSAAENQLAAAVADYHIAHSRYLFAIGSEDLGNGN